MSLAAVRAPLAAEPTTSIGRLLRLLRPGWLGLPRLLSPPGPLKALEGGFYHIIARGNNRQSIFNDVPDFNKFLENRRIGPDFHLRIAELQVRSIILVTAKSRLIKPQVFFPAGFFCANFSILAVIDHG
jgi:hypothetical protein